MHLKIQAQDPNSRTLDQFFSFYLRHMAFFYHSAAVLFPVFMRQSQWRERFELLGSSYHQIKYIQKAIPHARYITTCYFCRVSTLGKRHLHWKQLSSSDDARRRVIWIPRTWKSPGVVLGAKSLQEFCWWLIGCCHKSMTWYSHLNTLLQPLLSVMPPQPLTHHSYPDRCICRPQKAPFSLWSPNVCTWIYFFIKCLHPPIPINPNCLTGVTPTQSSVLSLNPSSPTVSV